MIKEIELYNDGIGKVQLIDYMGDDKKIVNSARVSFGQDNDKPLDTRDIKLIRYLIDRKHTSTLEHNVVTFKFIVPLFIRSQHHRHRTWSYNEISRRYTEENLKFYEPSRFRTQHKSNRQASNENELIDPLVDFDGSLTPASLLLKEHNLNSVNLYNKLMKSGVCREQARGVLSQNLYTEYYGTVNLGNLLKFIELRSHEGAQWEIQRVAEACLSISESLWPETIKIYQDLKNK